MQQKKCISETRRLYDRTTHTESYLAFDWCLMYYQEYGVLRKIKNIPNIKTGVTMIALNDM